MTRSAASQKGHLFYGEMDQGPTKALTDLLRRKYDGWDLQSGSAVTLEASVFKTDGRWADGGNLGNQYPFKFVSNIRLVKD